MHHKVSVIIPVYNRENYVGEAIESILTQTYKNVELIVIDDGSTDGTKKVVDTFRKHVKYLFQSNMGIAGARNTGIKASSGYFLSFLDSDDIWIQNKTEVQLNYLLQNPTVEMIFGNLIQFFSPELDDIQRSKIILPSGTMPGYSIGSLLISKENFLKVGYLDVNFKVGEFIDWYARAQYWGLSSHLLDQVVVKRRIHTSNQSLKGNTRKSDFNRILKNALDRKKQNGGDLS